MKEERIVLRADSEFLKRINKLAKELDISRSAYIRMLVNKEYLKRG